MHRAFRLSEGIQLSVDNLIRAYGDKDRAANNAREVHVVPIPSFAPFLKSRPSETTFVKITTVTVNCHSHQSRDFAIDAGNCH